MNETAPASLWEQLSAPFSLGDIQWRQDGKPFKREDGFAVRCVPFLSAVAVLDRLDKIAPGDWSYKVTPLGPITISDDGKAYHGFRGSLTVHGVTREDVGQGKDYKTASTDAFKRAAQRFGVGRELHAMKGVVVRVDGDGKNPRMLERPSDIHEQRLRGNQQRTSTSTERARPTSVARATPSCPKCGSDMYDNAKSKPPNYKCKDPKCACRIILGEDGQLPLDDARTAHKDALREG